MSLRGLLILCVAVLALAERTDPESAEAPHARGHVAHILTNAPRPARRRGDRYGRVGRRGPRPYPRPRP